MPNKKLIFITIIVSTAILVTMWVQSQKQQDYKQRIELAQQTNKAVKRLMFDLRQASQNGMSIPVDSQWHTDVSFSSNEGNVVYRIDTGQLNRINKGRQEDVAHHIHGLRMRRLGKTPGIVEVQLEARYKLSLISNFNIRLRD